MLDLIDSGNYRTYNIKIAQELGSVNAAIMLSELLNRYNYHKGEGELANFKKYEGVWFFYQIQKGTDRTCLSDKEQASAIRILEKLKLLEKRQIGIPAKRYFNLDLKAINDFINGSNNISRTAKKAELETTKRQNRKCQNGVPKEEHHKEPQEEHQEEEKEGETPKPPVPPPPKKKPIKAKKEEPIRNLYGSSKNVKLSDKEFQELLGFMTEARRLELIEDLSLYMSSTGKFYKCHYSTLLSWERKEKKTPKGTGTKPAYRPTQLNNSNESEPGSMVPKNVYRDGGSK